MENPRVRSGSFLNLPIALYFERLLAIWEDLSEGQGLLLFFGGLVLICGAAAFIGAVPTRIYGHDIFVLLDNGWRVINGQRPHLDYYSPWGPLMFLVSGLGLTLSRHLADGVGYGNAIASLIIGTWSFCLGRNRLAPAPRVLLSLFLAALVATPYPLGGSPFASSHAMTYNRYGYALVGLILIETFKPSRGVNTELMGGISTGAALGLTLFLKASYFLIGAGAIGIVSLLVWRIRLRRFLSLIVGFSFVSFCMLAYLHFDLAAMIKDLRMAAGARSESLTPEIPIWVMLAHMSVLLGVVLFASVAAISLGRNDRLRGMRLPVLAAFMFLVDVGLLSSNAQHDSLAACAIFAILVVNEITEDQHGGPKSFRPYYAAVLCLGALLFIPQFISDLAGLGYGVWKKERPSTPAAVLRFTSPNLKPLLLYDGANPRSNGRNYTTYVNDGVALLERETRPNELVQTMDMTNPFPYAMERRPPRGGIAAMAYNYTISDSHRPTDEAYFGDADIVMVPKHPAQDDIYYTGFWKAYEPGLHQRFKLAAESDWWWMYRRI